MNSGGKSIGILCWEAGSSPRGLEQLESLVGNSVNPLSYDFPVVFRRVKGANIQTVLEDPDPEVLSRFIETGKAMISEGVKAITTSCGFNAIFQREL
ncbi:MAG: aspartate/glutamate racemase family protein, partial [Deltaproteobacteria bacterium]|nr:aspartate/glutamate racemase family protein [Deltaproteobacteria bacterium]